MTEALAILKKIPHTDRLFSTSASWNSLGCEKRMKVDLLWTFRILML